MIFWPELKFTVRTSHCYQVVYFFEIGLMSIKFNVQFFSQSPISNTCKSFISFWVEGKSYSGSFRFSEFLKILCDSKLVIILKVIGTNVEISSAFDLERLRAVPQSFPPKRQCFLFLPDVPASALIGISRNH